jgi:flavin reductase (DIM6/NTAB) family NADH-FMN oxidoreductase RutF
VRAHYDGGDHVILVGKVLRFSASENPDDQPLIFYRGMYHSLQVGDERAPLWPLPIHY